jgi:hypothetical protein
MTISEMKSKEDAVRRVRYGRLPTCGPSRSTFSSTEHKDHKKSSITFSKLKLVERKKSSLRTRGFHFNSQDEHVRKALVDRGWVEDKSGLLA